MFPTALPRRASRRGTEHLSRPGRRRIGRDAAEREPFENTPGIPDSVDDFRTGDTCDVELPGGEVFNGIYTTANPTPRPTFLGFGDIGAYECGDSDSWFYKKSKQDCEYVSKDADKYCKAKNTDEDGVSAIDACKETCGGCAPTPMPVEPDAPACEDSTSWYYKKSQPVRGFLRRGLGHRGGSSPRRASRKHVPECGDSASAPISRKV